MSINNNARGFTLIELMIVVAIIGILSSIAIPSYTGYITQSKISAMEEHQTNALRLIKAEASKIAAGGQGKDVIDQLNLGDRKAVGSTSDPAFANGGAGVPGQVIISGIDTTTNLPAPGDTIKVSIIPVPNTTATSYNTPLTITFTIE